MRAPRAAFGRPDTRRSSPFGRRASRRDWTLPCALQSPSEPSAPARPFTSPEYTMRLLRPVVLTFWYRSTLLTRLRLRRKNARFVQRNRPCNGRAETLGAASHRYRKHVRAKAFPRSQTASFVSHHNG